MKKAKLKLIQSNSQNVKLEWIRLAFNKNAYIKELSALAEAMNIQAFNRSTMIERIAIKIWLYERQGIPF